MRLKYLAVYISLLCVGLLFGAACGGGAESKPTVAQPTSTVSANPISAAPTSAPAPVTAPTAAPAQSLTGTLLEKALDPPPYELDNVRYGGTLRSAVSNSNTGLDPKVIAQYSDISIAVEEPVQVVANEKDTFSHFEPGLAESWTVSPDLKTYTFKLRQGVKFHNIPPVNGRELVSDDVVFSLKRFAEKDSLFNAQYSQIDSVEAPDRYTVVVKLKEPNAWLFNDLWGTQQYIHAAEVVKQGNGDMGLNIIGTGPYMLQKHTPRQGSIYVRNPNYWGKDKKGNQLPYTDTLTYTFVLDPATITAAFRTGQLDVRVSVSNVGSYRNLEAIAKSVPGMRVLNGGLPTSQGLSFNTKRAPWTDVRLRRAINMLIDKPKYASTALENPIYHWSSPIPWSTVSETPFTPAELGPYAQYNPAEAKKLLIEAGFPDGKMKVGSPLDVIGSPSQVSRSQVLQDLLKQNGVEMAIQPLDPTTYYSKWYLHNYADIGYTYINTGDWSLNWFAQNKYLTGATQNTSLIDDPEVQRVVKEIKTTTDPAKLRQLARFLWDFDTLGSWNVFLPADYAYQVTSGRVRNFTLRTGATFSDVRVMVWLTDAPRTAP